MKPTRYPGITMLGENYFNIRVRAVCPKTGKIKGVERKRRCSLKEALELQASWAEAIRRGGPRRERRPRLSDYAESWLASKLPTLKRSTRRKYLDCLVHHILPDLGSVYLDALTPADVRAWVARQRDRYAGNTVLNALRVLRTLTRDAVIDLRLPFWPCERVSPPRGAAPGRENLLSAAELARLLEVMREKQPYWHALTMTLAYTGLRWSEATALRWSDIDETQGVIWVQRGNWRGHVDTTKTDRERSVPYTAELREVLEAHRTALASRPTTRSGQPCRQHEGYLAGWMFPSRSGGLYKGWNLSKVIRPLLAEAGIARRFTTHGLRRTFNNLLRLVAEGQVVRAITGHSTVAMTEHYSHVDAAEKEVAVAKVIRLVRSAAPTPGTPAGEKVADRVADPAGEDRETVVQITTILGGAGQS